MKARSMALAIAITIALTGIVGGNLAAQAGPNDFFGSNLSSSLSGSPEVTQGSQASAGGYDGMQSQQASAGMPMGGPPAGDYTVDEKRVQRKFKDNVKRAQKLISRGEEMMKSSDDKVSKKGKVLKEIGERALAELKANNPFPEIATKEPKKTH